MAQMSRVPQQKQIARSHFAFRHSVTFELPKCTYASVFLVVHSAFDDCRTGARWARGKHETKLACSTILTEVFYLIASVGFQASITNYLQHEFPHLGECEGICLKLQLLTVAVFIGEMGIEFRETVSMLLWMWYTTHVEYTKEKQDEREEKKDEDEEHSSDSSLADQATAPVEPGKLCWPERFIGMAFIGLVRLCVALFVLHIGSGFIIRSENNKDLVLNCVAMTFVVKIDEMMHKMGSSSVARSLTARVKPYYGPWPGTPLLDLFALFLKPTLWFGLTALYVWGDNPCGATRKRIC